MSASYCIIDVGNKYTLKKIITNKNLNNLLNIKQINSSANYECCYVEKTLQNKTSSFVFLNKK